MTTSTTPTIATGTYVIDAVSSSVTFEARHIFGLGPVQCSFAIRDGSIRIAADPAESSVDATLDAASFATNNPKRDKDIRSKRFLDVTTYPDITFAGTVRGTPCRRRMAARRKSPRPRYHLADHVPRDRCRARRSRAGERLSGHGDRAYRPLRGGRSGSRSGREIRRRAARGRRRTGRIAVPAKERGRRSVTLRLPLQARR